MSDELFLTIGDNTDMATKKKTVAKKTPASAVTVMMTHTLVLSLKDGDETWAVAFGVDNNDDCGWGDKVDTSKSFACVTLPTGADAYMKLTTLKLFCEAVLAQLEES